MHDSQDLTDFLHPVEAGRDIWADSVYRSEAIEVQLKTKRLRSKIHQKGACNTSLAAQQKTGN